MLGVVFGVAQCSPQLSSIHPPEGAILRYPAAYKRKGTTTHLYKNFFLPLTSVPSVDKAPIQPVFHFCPLDTRL